MNQKQKEVINAGLTIGFIIALFILSSYVVSLYLDELKAYSFSHYYLGVFVYIFIFTLSIVVAPISSLPLVPFASQVWGWQLAAIYSVIGWTIGDIIAFLLSRKYGKPLIKRLISLKEVEKIEKYIPENHIFASIVLLRMTLPSDGLSYALGLFSNIKFKTYLTATIIGSLPFAFVFAYLGTLSVKWQILGIIISFILVGMILHMGYKIRNKNRASKKI